MTTPSELLNVLPVFKGQKELISTRQSNGDIVREVLEAHEFFKPDYDAIAGIWERSVPCESLPASLYRFCKKNLKYREEAEADQTTRSPAGILAMRTVDCKHYSGFIAGVLDAVNRRGKCFYDWSYRFASYDVLQFSPGHVFVVVSDGDNEIWIDPVPDIDSFNARNLRPFYKWDKKGSSMALNRLSGIRLRPIAKGFTNVNTVSRSSLSPASPGCVRGIGAPAASYYHASNGAVYADQDQVRKNGFTPDQLGLPFAMEVLARGYDNKFPGAADAWWANPPVTFWFNGQQVPLPAPNTVEGGSVPLLPVGLTVQYAPSFNGVNIPANFIKPIVVAGKPGFQNKLQLSAVNMPGMTTKQTSDLLSANSSLLLIILEAAVGPLINSFSAFPYASNFGSTNNLDDKMFNHRNADDLLQPSISKSVLQTVAPYAEAILPYLVPGLGSYASNLLKTVAPAQASAAGPSMVQQQAPPLVQASGGVNILSTIEQNPVPALLIGGVAVWALFELLGGK